MNSEYGTSIRTVKVTERGGTFRVRKARIVFAVYSDAWTMGRYRGRRLVGAATNGGVSEVDAHTDVDRWVGNLVARGWRAGWTSRMQNRLTGGTR